MNNLPILLKRMHPNPMNSTVSWALQKVASFTPIRWALDNLWDLSFLLFTEPLFNVYLYGPRVLFCWEGKELPEICAELIPMTNSELWETNMEACEKLILQHYSSWAIIAQMILFYFSLYQLFA